VFHRVPQFVASDFPENQYARSYSKIDTECGVPGARCWERDCRLYPVTRLPRRNLRNDDRARDSHLPGRVVWLLHKTRLHFIGIQYTLPDNKTGGILLQGDKDSYRAILVALQGVTGAPVSVAEKDREFVPVNIRTQVTKGEEENPTNEKSTEETTKESTPTEGTSQGAGRGTVNVSSDPAGADVFADGDFVGNSPAVLKSWRPANTPSQ
jgi:hypothetical protein